MKRHIALAAAASLLASAHSARAAGLSVDTQSAQATGMATAVTGMVDDSSAIYYNPAGIARGRSIDAQAGVSLIMPTITFTDLNNQSTTTPFSVVPPVFAYVSGGITDHLSAGVGLFTPYGLTIGWPAGWEGRSVITSAKLATYYINPTVAYQLGPLRIGVGLQAVYGTVDLQRDLALPGGTFGSTELGGDAWGLGANVGLQLEAVPQVLSFGAHYRSAVALPFDDGAAHFTGIPSSLAGTLHDQAAATRFVLPDSFAFGAAIRPTKKLVLDLDVVYYGWNHLQSVNITFPNDASGTLSSSSSLPKNWSAAVNVHLGGEYTINDAWRVRAGVMLDPSPSPGDTLTPDLPDMWRINFAVGGGYRHKSGLRFDLGYEFLALMSRTSTAPELSGTYSGFANIVTLGVGFGYPAKTAPPP